jgi:hypothetical protein
VRALFALAVLPLASCFGGGYECTTDFDCGAGSVCANTHDCLSPGSVQRVAVHWTVRGNRADDVTCAPIASLDLAVFDDESDDQASYAPVPCTSGQFVFDKLPSNFDRVLLRVIDGGETVEGRIPPGGGDVYLDLTTGALPDIDAGPVVDASPPDAAPLADAGI